jgi:hypothetical protein
VAVTMSLDMWLAKRLAECQSLASTSSCRKYSALRISGLLFRAGLRVNGTRRLMCMCSTAFPISIRSNGRIST